MSAQVETFQLDVEQAEAYEAQFVPVLFGQWARLLVDVAAIEPGQAVLDVACGTGVVARAAADLLAGDGSVAGLDLNEAMLTVARRLRPDLDWRQGDALELPFPDGTFDVVLCQSGLMFFPDPVRALAEMRRVVRRDGTVAVQVWSGLDAQPAYRPLFDIIARHAGREAVDLVNTYFSLGDLDEIQARLVAADLRVTGTSTHLTVMRLPSVDAAVAVEVRSTPLGQRITEEVYERILADTRTEFARFCDPAGALHLPIEGAVVTAR
ncbi:MAG: class I SAM-dependent methyltransferase, partial [Actinomycetes bacterium]